MGLLSILGRLELDATPWKSTLENTDKQVEKFAKGTTKKLAGLAGGAIGLAALKQMGMAAITNAAEISKLAKQFNLTTDQVQQLKEESDKTGTSFGELVKDAGELEKTLARIDGNGVMFSQETVERLTAAADAMKIFKDAVGARVGEIVAGVIGVREGNRLTPEQQEFSRMLQERELEKRKIQESEKQRIEAEKEIAKINAEAAEIEKKTSDDRLTKQEKLNALEKERARILRDIEIAPFEAGTKGAAEDRLRLARVNARIADVEKEKATPEARKALSPLTDSLTSVGNFLGGSVNTPEAGLLREANQLLKQIQRNTERQSSSAFPL